MRGYTFTGWYADKNLTEKISNIKMTSDKTIYAGWKASTVPDMLNGDDHYAYVIGYSDGNVRPNANVSRAETATIFFRLLNADIRDGNLTAENTFTDVVDGQWCNKSVSTMAKLGIVKGRTAEIFDPYAPITRAEFAVICARFDTKQTNGNNNFSDISGHWAEAEIKRAAALGWIAGYPDGTFRPNDYITRAQAMTMINRVLCRMPQDEEDLLGRHLGQFRKLGYLGNKIVDRDDRRGIALGRDAALGLGCDGAAGGHQVYFLQAAIVRFHFRDALLSSVGEVV